MILVSGRYGTCDSKTILCLHWPLLSYTPCHLVFFKGVLATLMSACSPVTPDHHRSIHVFYVQVWYQTPLSNLAPPTTTLTCREILGSFTTPSWNACDSVRLPILPNPSANTLFPISTMLHWSLGQLPENHDPDPLYCGSNQTYLCFYQSSQLGGSRIQESHILIVYKNANQKLTLIFIFLFYLNFNFIFSISGNQLLC